MPGGQEPSEDRDAFLLGLAPDLGSSLFCPWGRLAVVGGKSKLNGLVSFEIWDRWCDDLPLEKEVIFVSPIILILVTNKQIILSICLVRQ
jgi:hypothetical protein